MYLKHYVQSFLRLIFFTTLDCYKPQIYKLLNEKDFPNRINHTTLFIESKIKKTYSSHCMPVQKIKPDS